MENDYRVYDCVACPLEVDTFLAVTKVKPIEPEAPRRTVKEKQKIREELEECLSDDFEMPEDFWDDEKKEEPKIRSLVKDKS